MRRAPWAAGLVAMAFAAVVHGQVLPAFPGGEGFGAVASGGRGKPVVYVTNLDDSGPGSLREALSAGDRNVLFAVSGTIHLKSKLTLKGSNVTIAGQTAPGDGVCLRGKELMINGNNVIVRFMRFRPGDELNEEHDALTVWGARDVIIDHCSMSWSTDSVSDVVKESRSVTIQWSIISEPLDRSVHAKGSHGYGTGWSNGSYHHNLIAHCASRSPRLAAHPTRGMTDVRNNVIYNWGFGWAYGGEHADINLVANYYKPGPSSAHNDILFNVWEDTCRLFIAGNVMHGNDSLTADNRGGVVTTGVTFDRTVTLNGVVIDWEFPAAMPVHTQPAAEAYEAVLQSAGATRPRRDPVDERIIDEVRSGTGKLINSPTDVGGWPELRAIPAPEDQDLDGMPDEWERQQGLNATDAGDGARPAGAGLGYTNLEVYLNTLAAQ